ncbi:MAG: oligosaccharide flippase family protein [Clostridia bacterium]|nr:oligosaccharide flippase family protein [Clostridia bacterium]
MSLSDNAQRKAGTILAYISIFVSSAVGIAFTPYMISKLGDIEYGLYQSLHSIIGYIALLDFGLGSTLTRFILKYRADKDEQKVDSVISMSIKIYCFFGIIAMLLVGILSLNLETVFKGNINGENVEHARSLLLIMGATSAISFVSHALTGIQNAHEKHLVIKGVYIVRQLFRVALIMILLNLKVGAIAVAGADFVIALLLLSFDLFYCKFSLKVKLFKGKWEHDLLKGLFSYSAFVFLQIMITQTNNGLDRVLLGRFSTFEVVALYGVVMQLYNLFSSVGGVISGITLPKISKTVFANVSREELTDCCAKFSRFQLYISCLLIGGFLLLGRDFASLWVPGYDSFAIWVLVLLIVTPQQIESVEGTVFNAMKAKNKQATRSLILFGIMVLNIILTIALIHVSPIYGPAIGTCISIVIGNNIVCNIYYHKKIGVDMIRYFKHLVKGILPAWLISMVIGCFITFIPVYGWLGFIIKGCLYVLVFAACELVMGLNKSERVLVNSVLKKIRR